MSLDLMQLVCDVKYITRGCVVVAYARVSVVDVIQEMKISNTSNRLVLSQSHEKCDDNLVRTPYTKSIWIFWEVNKSKQTCIIGYLCLLFVYIGRTQSYGGSQHICWRQYHEAVAFKWKYFQIIKRIRNQLFMWKANKLRVHRGEGG